MSRAPVAIAPAPAPSAPPFHDAEASGQEKPLLDVRNLTVAYADKTVVRDVSFSVPAGGTLALIGESGSGKSTIARAVLRLLAGRKASATGQIDIGGEDTTALSDRAFLRLRGRVLGFVPQDPSNSLNPVRTIGSQALEAAALVTTARTGALRRRLVLEALERVGLPDPERVFESFPHQLSGGQLQRVLIALAIIPGPDLIVADEPTSALDATVQQQILDLLASLRQELGLGILLITHDLAVAAEQADDVVVLRDGRIQESGPTARVFATPATTYTRKLQADAPGLHPHRFDEIREARDKKLSEGADDESGKAQGALPHRGAAPVEPPVRVELRGVSRSFHTQNRSVRALEDVSFSVRRGRTHALVGESGSGKSTAARILLGLEVPDAGSILIDDRPVQVNDSRELRALRRNLQIVYQNPYTSLNPRFTVGRIVREPLDLYRAGDPSQRRQQVRWALEAVHLSAELASRRASELSGGQRQRVAIARALVLHPEVLVLDEPTSALDVTVQASILEVLAKLQRDLGLTYLFISHDLGVVRQFADTMTVLRRGQVVESGRVTNVFTSPGDDYTRRLISSIPARRHEAEAPTPKAPSKEREAERITWVHTDWDDERVSDLQRSMREEIGPRYAALREAGSPPAMVPQRKDVAEVVLALVDDVPAATGTLHRLPDRWEVKRLFVDPSHRGLGLARQTLARVEQAARDRGATKIYLQTGNRQPEAISLYQREGWIRTDVYEPYDPDDGISVCFYKEL
jgi:peptide/nickel transport system ATP-binding protein